MSAPTPRRGENPVLAEKPAETSAPGVPAASGAVAAPAVGRRGEALYFALRNKKVIGGLTVILAMLLLGLIAPLFADHGPSAYVGPRMQAPSAEYWFGTTIYGQDVFLQFTSGLRSTFLVGVLAGLLAAVLGMTIGFLAGYWGGVVDEILNMITNVVLVLPVLAVLIVVNAYLGVRNVPTQAVVIGLFSWPWVARAVRAQTLSLRSREFVDLARLTGVRSWKIISREIAPNMSSYLLLVFILLFGGAILFAAGLDFIGLGPTDAMSLGLMMNHAVHSAALTLGMWWWFVPPGLGIVLIVGALYVTNVGLDEVFNPKLREM